MYFIKKKKKHLIRLIDLFKIKWFFLPIKFECKSNKQSSLIEPIKSEE